MDVRVKSLQDLAKALNEIRRQEDRDSFIALLARTQEDEAALVELRHAGLGRVPKHQTAAIAAAFYNAGKHRVAKLGFAGAAGHFQAAHELHPRFWLYNERLRLAGAALRPTSLDWKLSLIQLKSDLQLPCPKDPCLCTSHFQIANCRHALEPDYDHETVIPGRELLDGVYTYTVGHYFAFTKRTRWTKWLKAVKGEGRSELLKPIADIAADFIVEHTPLLTEVDVLVPVAPDPHKFARRGFAPNDRLAKALGARLALPCRMALTRHGGGTRACSYDQLAAEFEVDSAEIQYLRDLTVLLVEDIWTWGRTIPICAKKLRDSGARQVFALSLAESTF